MIKHLNTFHVTIISISVVVLFLSYITCLKCMDAILINYDIINSVSDISENPKSISNQIEILEQRLKNNINQLEIANSKKPFYPNLFKDMSKRFHCELSEMEASESPKSSSTQYRIVYSGKIKSLLNLLHEFETKYFVSMQKVGLSSATVDGNTLRLVVLMQASKNE